MIFQVFTKLSGTIEIMTENEPRAHPITPFNHNPFGSLI
jgi:hypothetical protein